MSTLPDLAPDALFTRVAGILEQARARAVPAVQNEMALAYWYFGREIVTELQQGAARAGYGDALLTGLSARVTGRFGKGYSETNLKYFRQFYIVSADRTSEIRHEPRDESVPLLPGPRLSLTPRAPRWRRPSSRSTRRAASCPSCPGPTTGCSTG